MDFVNIDNDPNGILNRNNNNNNNMKISVAAATSDSENYYEPSPRHVPFWINDINVLLKPKYITELFPSANMSPEQQLNALTRLLIIVGIMVFLSTREPRTLIIVMVTIASVVVYYLYKDSPSLNRGGTSSRRRGGGIIDGFRGGENNADVKQNFKVQVPINLPTYQPVYKNRAETAMQLNNKNPLLVSSDTLFDTATSRNPFANVLVTDYTDNPNKKPAEPLLGDPDVAISTDGRIIRPQNNNNAMFEQAKKMVLENNPGQRDLTNKLFTDMGDKFVFEQSLRPFYSTASTTIPNDQAGFAEFCYGSMVSCKEGNMFACARNLPNQIL